MRQVDGGNGALAQVLASRMHRSVVDVADLNTGASIQPSSSAVLSGLGTKMGSWQKLSLPGDQRCICGSLVASGAREIFKMSCSQMTDTKVSQHLLTISR